MKRYVLLMLIPLALSCTNSSENDNQTIDYSSELQSIEVTRNGFTSAIKEKRYEDLRNWTANDVFTIGPGDAKWEEMFASRTALGLFPYDSIIMSPKETVILNDTMAYDFGTSRVYYSDTIGEIHLLRDTYLALLKKDTLGRWRLFREVASSRVFE